ncbi:hypothetical protein QQ045_007978 [Rhodiola kirilowii]
MSLLSHSQHVHQPLRPLRQPRHSRAYSRRVVAVTTPIKPKLDPNPTPSQTPLVLNKARLDLDRPVGPNDPSLLSTWYQRAWVTSGCTTILISLAQATVDSNHLVETVVAALVGYVFADLGSGVYHWGIDNYGDASTPIFGSQIEAFQGHHRWPWTITRRQFANNLHSLAKVITFTVLPLDLIVHNQVAHGFISVCSFCIMFSQQFHAWAHGTKSRLPSPVVALQDMGVLVSRSQHADHHRAPYNNNYCIVSGVWNEFLDQHNVFLALELVLFFRLGIRPRSWTEPNSDWIEQTQTY